MNAWHLNKKGGKKLTVGTNNGGTPGYAHHTVNEDLPAMAEGCLDEETSVGKVDKEILIL